MTLHLVALDADLYKIKFELLPINEPSAGHGSGDELANQYLHRCMEECQITKFSSDLIVPEATLFDDWANAIPDFEKVKECMIFLNQLQHPGHDTNIWWIEKSSLQVRVFSPEAISKFAANVHSCKFYEILLANIVTGEMVYQFIELSEFIELSCRNACFLFSWQDSFE